MKETPADPPLDAAVDVRLTSRPTDTSMPNACSHDHAIRYPDDLPSSRSAALRPDRPPPGTQVAPRPDQLPRSFLFSSLNLLLPARSRQPLCIWPRHKHL